MKNLNDYKDDDLLTTDQVSEIMQLGIPTIVRLAHKGVIKGYKIGHQMRFYFKDIIGSLKEARKSS